MKWINCTLHAEYRFTSPQEDGAIHLFTDASLQGWGAILFGNGLESSTGSSWQDVAEEGVSVRAVQFDEVLMCGRWPALLRQHINALETAAVAEALQQLTCRGLQRCALTLPIDNTSTICALRRSRSRHLTRIFHYLQQFDIKMVETVYLVERP